MWRTPFSFSRSSAKWATVPDCPLGIRSSSVAGVAIVKKGTDLRLPAVQTRKTTALRHGQETDNEAGVPPRDRPLTTARTRPVLFDRGFEQERMNEGLWEVST